MYVNVEHCDTVTYFQPALLLAGNDVDVRSAVLTVCPAFSVMPHHSSIRCEPLLHNNFSDLDICM